NANFKYLIGGGFDLGFGGIYETSRSDIQHYASGLSSEAKQYVADYTSQNTDGTLKYGIPKGGYLRQTNANTSSYTVRAQLNFNKTINGLHSVTAMVGAEVRNLISKSSMASYFGYNDQTLLQQAVDYGSIVNGTLKGSFGLYSPFSSAYDNLFGQQYNEDRFLSGYSTVVYSFRNTYTITGSARIDQSNLFGTNPKYKYKPLWSVGAGWNIDKEDFMKDISWIKQLKLRGSYGFNGNVAKMSLPEVIAQYVINTYTSPYTTALKLYTSGNSYAYANSSLRWEQTKNVNIGIDYHIFRSIYGTIDYYQKTSTDLLGNAQIDPTIGLSPTIINKASISNKGIELSLHADWITKKNFNWNTGLVIARNTSKTVDVYQKVDYNPQTLNLIGYVKGYPVGAMFAFNYGGLDTAGYPIVVSTKGNTYSTINPSSTSPFSYAMKSDTSGIVSYAGSSIPTINAGLSNRIDYGNFYLYVMVNYYGGFKVRVPRPNPAVTRPLEGSGTYWKQRGDENNTDVMALAAFGAYNSINPYNYADRYVVSGDYFTLGDVTLSYSLDNMQFIRKAGFTHFEVKAQASNVWTVGMNKYNYSVATGSYQKSYLTPTYTLGIFTNF
ncbi:MAG: SusC/RagA family TonB-linked outer membrane protein, partial [Bacteroidetes bacterium]|nr:SusC/RagA family TonB-linked outer membrane protein [Bacteroidota bacterium]